MSTRSPISLTLLPVAEVLGQLRELVKDLQYRNRQEKQMGDLKILEQQCELASKYGTEKVYCGVIFTRIEAAEKKAILRGLLESQGEVSESSPKSPQEVKPVPERVQNRHNPK